MNLPPTSFGEMVGGGRLKGVGRLVGSRVLKYLLDQVNCLVNIESHQEKNNNYVSIDVFVSC